MVICLEKTLASKKKWKNKGKLLSELCFRRWRWIRYSFVGLHYIINLTNPKFIIPQNVAAYAGRLNILNGGWNYYGEFAYKINDPINSLQESQMNYASGSAFTNSLTYSQRGFGITARLVIRWFITQVNSLALTKLDGTAKGGVVIGISDQLQIPVRYIGVGEGMEDLQMFDKEDFVNTLFNN